VNRNGLAPSRGQGVTHNGDGVGNKDEVLTIGGAAILCGVSRSTVRRAVARGHLRAWHTPGRHLRFSRAGCIAFAESLGQVELVGRPYLETPLPAVGMPGVVVEA
jgi:excisionase family DNA binding protein